MSLPYTYTCFIPFHLADPGGILFFGHAFSLVHQAFEQFIVEKLDCPWNEWFQNPEWIVPVRHAEADYLQPVRAGTACRIELKVIETSHSSFTLEASLFQEKLCCLIKTVHVFCDRTTKVKISIPQRLALVPPDNVLRENCE